MRFLELLGEKSKNLNKTGVPTVAFLGDSVTQGCFECYVDEKGAFETVFDREAAYHHDFEKILALLFPSAPVHIINAGLSGTTAEFGLQRLERDVLCHHPDLTVVCFGLNDCGKGMNGLGIYTNSLRGIFQALRDQGGEVIFMTANMMNPYVSYHMPEDNLKRFAEQTAKLENNGILKAYFEAGKQVARECGVAVCDVYEKWKKFEAYGVKIPDLLSNYINHPVREMHWLFATSLLETLMA